MRSVSAASSGRTFTSRLVSGFMVVSQYDLAEVIFQLSVKDMTDNSMFKNVIVDKIDSDSAVNLIAGSYASGKVYI